jgi:hypothetical protein
VAAVALRAVTRKRIARTTLARVQMLIQHLDIGDYFGAAVTG